jgi:hypothetical protein
VRLEIPAVGGGHAQPCHTGHRWSAP